MRAFLKTLTKKGPAFLATWGHILYDLAPPSIRYGKAWNEAIRLIQESESWDEAALVKYQEERLERLIHHAYTNVPYYREVFQEYDLQPRDIQSMDDLKKLPLLTKETVRRHKHELLATNIRAVGRNPAHTSGSTGTPLEFFMDNTTRPMDRALVLRHLTRLGYREGDRTAIFKALPLADPKRLWLYLPGSRELRFYFHDTDDKRLGRMVDELERFKPAFIDGWPSCLYVLARWMEMNGRSIQPPKYITTSSENQPDHIKEKIERVFKSRIIDWYGQEESCAVAIQCEHAGEYHIQMEMGVFELLPTTENCWEVVGTCLHNDAMPFIRYKTGDLAVKGSGHCPCGTKRPSISKIVGREIDFVITPEKKLISPLTFHMAFHEQPEVKEAQIIQEDLKTIRLLIAPWNGLSFDTRQKLSDELRSILGSPSMELIIQEVERVRRVEGCQKTPFLISNIPLEDRL